MVMPIGDKEYIAELEEERNGWKRDTIALREENARLRAALEVELAAHHGEGASCNENLRSVEGGLARAALCPEVKP